MSQCSNTTAMIKDHRNFPTVFNRISLIYFSSRYYVTGSIVLCNNGAHPVIREGWHYICMWKILA